MLKPNFVRVPTNGIQLNVAQAGPVDGPLLIFLHGFPEFWYGWRNQIEHFATLGYRVWAPDQRGYNLSDKPDAISDYTLDTLAGDIVGLIDAAGCARARVVGHDWGAAVTWWLA
ncbi:MAG: alpha/beta fold hydrolase, partial [Thermoflexales bacterium]|nr:alpha/beta fold hydrolase [Thermoflexales bacterium]